MVVLNVVVNLFMEFVMECIFGDYGVDCIWLEIVGYIDINFWCLLFWVFEGVFGVNNVVYMVLFVGVDNVIVYLF